MAKKKPAPKKAPPKKPKPSIAELSPQQMRFCAAYARTGDGAASAVEAGYAPGAAKVQASRLLTKANIRAEVDRLLSGALDKAEVSVERIVDELALVAFADIADFVEWGYDPLCPEAPQVRLRPSKLLDAAKRRAIVEVSEGQHGIKIKFADKIAALDRLGKHRGMFVDKHEITVPQATFNINLAGKAK